MQLSDRTIGILAVLGGCAMIYGTFGFRTVPGQPYDAAFFSRIVGVALIRPLPGLARRYDTVGAIWWYAAD